MNDKFFKFDSLVVSVKMMGVAFLYSLGISLFGKQKNSFL
jgi:hypothetical protein